MFNSFSKKHSSKLNPELYARLKAEAKAPYKGLRQFIYVAFGASGFIGAVVFLAQLAAGKEVYSALPNFAFQVGIVALMIFLFRRERKSKRN
jgi:hypothetical protein